MDSWSKPLGRLGDKASFFVSAKKLRLLVVRTSAEMRTAALRVLAKHEHHADNLGPFVLFEDPATGEEQGWPERFKRLAQDHAARSEALAKAGLELGPWSPSGAAGPEEELKTGLARFGAGLGATLRSLRAPLEGLTAILAPTRIEAGAAWVEDLRTLLSAPELAAVRWIVVVEDTEVAEQLAALEAPKRRVDCLLDPAAVQRDLRALAEGLDASTGGPAAAGAAWPRSTIPPERKGKPDKPPPPDKRPSPEDASGELVRHLFAAALAMREQRTEDAIEHQMEARDLAARLDMVPELLLIQLTLGGYLLSAGHNEAAYAAYASAAMWAEEAEMPEREAQARLALGMILATEGRTPAACEEYGLAAKKALEAGTPLLAIECWRIAGQLAAELDLEPQCVAAWSEALRIAGEHPDAAPRSSAADVGRLLAQVFRRLDQHAQAEVIETAAERFAPGAAPESAPASAPAPMGGA